MNQTYNEILNYMNTLTIIDTHEHLPSNEEDRDKNTDVLKEYLLHYFNRDLISAGLSLKDNQKIAQNGIFVTEKWKIIEPYWKVSEYTGYGRALSIAVKDIYGIDRIDADTIEELNTRFQKSLKPGHFKKVLKDVCRIKTSLLNVHTLTSDSKALGPYTRSISCDRSLFSPVYVIDTLVWPLSLNQIELIEEESDIRITSFKRWLDATEAVIEKTVGLGAIALKLGLAYKRTLRFEMVPASIAEDEFNNIFKSKHFANGWIERPVTTGKAFQDYMLHFILGIANKKKNTVQIHTGIQEGSGNILSNSNPVLLSNLFLEYPDITFDIFHIGYPYQNQLAVLAKNFSNVFIGMCWAHIVSPNASVNYLLELIDTVPLNKISAFGGDYLFIDGVCGHLVLAKENVAKTLSIKVQENLFDIDTAKLIAKMLFYDNPVKIFRLKI